MNKNIKNYLIDHCYDLDLIAEKLGKTPEDFRKALDSRDGVTFGEFMEICNIAKENYDVIYNYERKK